MSAGSLRHDVTVTDELPEVVRRDLEEICERAAPALQRLRDKTVLVAGGEGFLPSYLADALLHAADTGVAPGCRVICVDNRSTADPTRLARRAGRADFTLIEHDITVPLELEEPVDYVVHGAQHRVAELVPRTAARDDRRQCGRHPAPPRPGACERRGRVPVSELE